MFPLKSLARKELSKGVLHWRYWQLTLISQICKYTLYDFVRLLNINIRFIVQ